MTHLEHATFPAGVTLEVIPQTKANLLQATLTHTSKAVHKKTSKAHPRAATPQESYHQRRSPFKIHNQTPPWHHTMSLIL